MCKLWLEREAEHPYSKGVDEIQPVSIHQPLVDYCKRAKARSEGRKRAQRELLLMNHHSL